MKQDRVIPLPDSDFSRREHERTPFACRMRIEHPHFGAAIVTTRDVSDGGIYLVTGDIEMPPLGTVITGQVQDSLKECPRVNMEIVRVDSKGVGVRFVDEV